MKMFLLILTSLAVVLRCASAAAQSSCFPSQVSVEGAPFFEAWVDPSHGDDGTGITSSPAGTPSVTQAKASPFQTINAAISALASAVDLTNGKPGIVHLEPAIYDPSTQSFPIVMKNGVNVQGLSARECVLVSGGDKDVFYPVPTSDCDCGERNPRNVILDFSLSTGAPEYAEAVDGVTFRGADVQVYVDSQEFVTGRISNCIFDMVDYSTLPGPEFGLLMVHQYEAGYQSIEMHVLNNTFVMGWLPEGYEEGFNTCSPSAVGICDVNDPECGDPEGDPDPSLRNVGSSNIQNNLIRELTGGQSLAFLGMVQDDTAVSGPIDTNIFLNESTDNLTYCVDYRSPQHAPATSSVFYDDPAFVGEMLTNHFGLARTKVGRDWRVLPDSIVVDAGVGPTAGVLTAHNGVSHVEPSVLNSSCAYSAIDAYDFDGEGYGNRRIRGLAVDVGFDEFELMIDSGFGNESLNIPNSASPCAGSPSDPCYCVPRAGAGLHGFIFPGSGSVSFRVMTASCPSGSYTIPPGAVVPPTLVGSHYFWFTTQFTYSAGSTTVYTYTPPDGTTSHSFGLLTHSSANQGTFRLFQGRFGGAWSNLQASFD